MVNLATKSSNSVEKNIVNRIGNKKEQDKRKGDNDQGKKIKGIWGRIRSKTNTIDTFLKSIAILINKMLHHEIIPSLLRKK